MKAYVVDTAALRNNIHIVQERAGQASCRWQRF